MPYRIKALAGKPYQPSNGEEGWWFHGRFCEGCEEERDYWLNELDSELNVIGTYGCFILSLSMFLKPDDCDYPPELTHTEDGEPICTGFTKWLPDDVREFKKTEQKEFLPGMEKST